MAPHPPLGPVQEPDWPAIGAQVRRTLNRLLRAPREWLEDVVQDALLCMVILSDSGARINNHVAFGVAFATKRWIDEQRQRRRRVERLEPDLDEWEREDQAGAVQWPALLQEQGWEPTAAWCRILDAIASGAHGTNKIADALGLHRKTIQESRRRLRQWLREKLDPPPAP